LTLAFPPREILNFRTRVSRYINNKSARFTNQITFSDLINISHSRNLKEPAKMSLTDRTKLGETFNSPAELSDHQLLNMPLRNLSKGISLTISLSTTARVYLRWIELHRVQKTKFTEHWDNTILHWIQSLRARGFKEQDIINEMRFWKQKTGPLPSVEGRRLPELCDIEKAYKEISECSGETKSKDKTNWKHEIPRVDLPISYDDEPRRPYYAKEENSFEKYRSFPKKKLYENLQGPPPPSYVCNRCGKKGVFLSLIHCLESSCF
jgi:predicted SnoaL-like aldol condensation-catalyzing enzyme